MKKRYVTKKLVKRISDITTSIFKQSIIDVFNAGDLTNEQLTELMLDVRNASWFAGLDDTYPQESKDLLKNKEDVDELYLVKMIALSTKDLIDVLFLHEHGKPKRADRTLDAITSELARRSLLDDSSQSDTIYPNGDLNVKGKSKRVSKKANSKRRKPNKNRRVVRVL